MTIKQDGATFHLTSLENFPTSAPIISPMTFSFIRIPIYSSFLFCFRAGIAASNTSHVQYFDGEDRREKYDDFYEQVVRVKDIVLFGVFSFADTAQKLLVSYLREDLEQPRAGTWYEDTWTGENGHYSLAHAGYTGSNNNMGIEVDWRDMKHESWPSMWTLPAMKPGARD